MELNENLRNNLILLRKERGITQDILASALDISVQAISKWETGTSLPDIMQLPRIAKFFGVSIDYLFYNTGREENVSMEGIPDDNKLRVVQFFGNKMLDASLWEEGKTIALKISKEFYEKLPVDGLNAEIWGNASIEGDVRGYVECQGNVNCGNIGGYVESKGAVNCGNIGGYVESGGSVNCGNIEGYLECTGGVNCGNVDGNLESNGKVNCGSVDGYVECNGDLNCGNIGDYAECKGDIHCNRIMGNAECEGNIIYYERPEGRRNEEE